MHASLHNGCMKDHQFLGASAQCMNHILKISSYCLLAENNHCTERTVKLVCLLLQWNNSCTAHLFPWCCGHAPWRALSAPPGPCSPPSSGATCGLEGDRWGGGPVTAVQNMHRWGAQVFSPHRHSYSLKHYVKRNSKFGPIRASW